jgi:hypothetical protein
LLHTICNKHHPNHCCRIWQQIRVRRHTSTQTNPETRPTQVQAALNQQQTQVKSTTVGAAAIPGACVVTCQQQQPGLASPAGPSRRYCAGWKPLSQCS